MDLEEPYKIFENLTLADTEELFEDIRLYLSLEKAPSNIEFWQVCTVSSQRIILLRHLAWLTLLFATVCTSSRWPPSARLV